VSAADALAGFLRALGVPGASVAAGIDERAAQYRSLLAGRRVLVVLDNAATVAQVRPLLPGSPACAVVVTSRDTLAGLVARDGARRLDLDLLPAAEAAGLLRDLIGARAAADPATTEELALLCARLPLALRVAAEHVAARPSVPLADLVADLAGHPRPLDLLDAGGDTQAAVRTVFSWSYQHLDPAAARAFRLAGLHPGPDFDLYALAALTGTDLGQARQLAGVLVGAHLFQPAGKDRYTLHDLLRAYARELATAGEAAGPGGDGADDAEQRAALTRLFDHYLHVADGAAATLYPNDHAEAPRRMASAAPVPPVSTSDTAQAWLDAERANLVATAVHAAGHDWPDHAIMLTTVLYRYFYLGGHYLEAVTVHTCSREAARATGDLQAEAEALNRLGTFEQRQGHQEGITHLRESLELSRAAGDRMGEARGLTNVGCSYFQQGRYPEAADCLEQAVALAHELGHRNGEARALTNLSLADLRLGRYPLAISHLEQSLALARDEGNKIVEASVLSNLGLVLLRQGRYDEAAGHLGHALDICRDTRDKIGEAAVLDTIGLVALGQGHYERARGYCQQALTLVHEIGERNNEADVLVSLAEVDVRQGRYPQAADLLERALAQCRETGNPDGEGRALDALGEILRATGRPGEALVQHEAALAVAGEIDDAYARARAHDGLGHARHAVGDDGQARAHWQQALELYTRLGTPEAARVRRQLAAVPSLA